MKRSKRLTTSAACAALLCGVATLAAAKEGGGATQSATWQHHKTSINYHGDTALYTCSGLRDRVRHLLTFLGARSDLSVSATACPGIPDTPTHNIIVDVEFYSLAPAPAGSADAAPAGAVDAAWTPIRILPAAPGFMGDGDCELVKELEDLISQNFAVRDVEYRTDCFPHTISLNSYSVKAQVLKAAPAPKG